MNWEKVYAVKYLCKTKTCFVCTVWRENDYILVREASVWPFFNVWMTRQQWSPGITLATTWWTAPIGLMNSTPTPLRTPPRPLRSPTTCRWLRTPPWSWLATRAARRVASKVMEQVFGSIRGLVATSIIGFAGNWVYRKHIVPSPRFQQLLEYCTGRAGSLQAIITISAGVLKCWLEIKHTVLIIHYLSRVRHFVWDLRFLLCITLFYRHGYPQKDKVGCWSSWC